VPGAEPVLALSPPHPPIRTTNSDAITHGNALK